MSRILWVLLVVGFTVILDWVLVRVWRVYRQLLRSKKESGEPVESHWKLFRRAAEIEFSSPFWRKIRHRTADHPSFRQKLKAIFELTLIGLWAIYVGRTYLNLDPQVVPAGREFSSAIQTHHLWNWIKECGTCAFWNGSERGGYPAFADVHGSMLHPIVIFTTLIWDVVNGAKIALVVSFWFAGVAQWWIARSLRLSWLPRLWSAAAAVVGGHIVGRMELGAFGVVLSTAMCSLVFAAVLNLARKGGRRAAVILGIVTASALLSGQGYIQIGLAGIAPALLILLIDEDRKISPVWKDYVLALGLALLLAAPFVVPFLHFSPNFLKETDPEFKSAQSLAYLPLNLVINDWEFYHSEVLGKYPYPHLYTLFIGWIPVILAVVGLSTRKKKDQRYLWFMFTGVAIEFLIGSAVLLRWIAKIYPGFAGIRHPPQIAGLAVPLILGLSAYGLEYVLKLPWPDLLLELSGSLNRPQWKIPLRWVLLIPLFLSLKSSAAFSEMWVYTEPQGDGLYELVAGLKTGSLQWVNPPFGEHPYIEPAVRIGLKLSPGIMTFRWKDRDYPVPVLEANREGPPPGPVQQVAEIDGVPIYERQDQLYAAVVNGDSFEPCIATGTGGRLKVVCDTILAGTLVVKENTWTGWQAWMDGDPVELTGSHWLELNAPVGQHTFEFKYRPWDVPLGVSLFILGIVLCVLIWKSGPKNLNRSEALQTSSEP